MKRKNLILSMIFLTTIILSACSTQAATIESTEEINITEPSEAEEMEEVGDEIISDEMTDSESMNSGEGDFDESMSESQNDTMMEDQEGLQAEDDMTDSDDEAMMEDQGETMMDDPNASPSWFSVELIEARSGQPFTIADFKGKVVLVENLAMWCSKCLQQQVQVLTLHDNLGKRDDFISLGIDIDPNENIEALKSYIKQNGFHWYYTVAPVEVAREIGQLYGSQFLNPPSTPMLIIDRHGEVHPLPFGIKSTESLMEALQPFLDESM